MAERVIGLRIQLNGIDTVITDIKTLENEIRKAKEDLKQVEIGGPIFNQLAKEISQAETKLQGLNDAARGISKEKSLEGFGKLGAGISSSFAAATAAVSLFGKQSESVQKAATDAQNLLTIALSIRGIAEVRTGALIVAKTIAEKASTAATLATNAATKALYTTMAANPIGVILVAVGLLVTAYFALSGAEEEVAEKTKTLNELRAESQKSIVGETNKLKTLQTILNDGNVSLEAKKGAYRELQKSVPILSNLTLEQAKAQGILNTSIEDEIKLIELRAKQKAYESFFIQEESKRIDKNIKAREAFIGTLGVELNQERQRLYYAGLNADAVEAQITILQNRRLAQAGYTDELDTYKTITAEIAALENKKTEQLVKQGITIKAAEASEQKRISLLLNEIELYAALLDYQAKLTSSSYKLGEADAKVVETAKARVASLEALRVKLVETLPFEEQFKLKLESTFSIVEDKAGPAFRDLIKSYNEFIDESLKVNTSLDGLKENLSKTSLISDEFRKSFGDQLSPETIKQIEKLDSNYKKLAITLFEISQAKIEPPFDIPAFRKAFKELSDLETEARIFSPEDTDRIKLEAERQKKEYVRAFVELQTATKENQEKLAEIRKKGLQPDDEAATIKKLTDAYVKQGETFFEGLKTNVLEIEKFNTGIDTTATTVEVLNKKIKELTDSGELLGAFLLENRDLFANAYDVDLTELAKNRTEADKIINEVAKKTYDKEKLYLQQVSDFEKKLLLEGIDIAKLTYEQKLELLKDALAKEIDLVTPKKSGRKSAKDIIIPGTEISLQDVSDALGTFNQLMGQTASLVAQSYAFQLSQLEKQSKKALEQVTGDTELANQKRIELEKQYQIQKAEIEKRALIKSLQFQLIQGIADTAQAVISVIEIPPLAIAVGILGAIQVGLIAQQLAQAQSMAGGGMIKMGAGGMVMGPSHEMGGVSYAGGVNLEGGESVINRQSSLNYAGLLSQINQSGGGQPIVNNPSNSLMEERLMQAISRANQQPIRAYVLNSEITSAQAINRRLNELATL